MSIEQIVKEKKAKAKKKNLKKITAKVNKEKRRSFINYICIKCKREYHIQIHDKEDWKGVDLKKHICPICAPTKIRRI